MPPVLNHLWPSASPPGQYAHPPSSATLNGLEGSTGGLRRCVLWVQMNWMRARAIAHESDICRQPTKETDVWFSLPRHERFVKFSSRRHAPAPKTRLELA